MNSETSVAGYVGSAPGQSLSAMLERFTLKDLRNLIGEDVISLLGSNAGSDRERMVKAAVQVIETQPETLRNLILQNLIVRNLDNGKHQELKDRLERARLKLSDLPSGSGLEVLGGFLGVTGKSQQLAIDASPVDSIDCQFGLFPHQRSVVRRTYDRIGVRHGRTVIHMPTGAGKTRTAMHFAARILNEYEPCVIVWLASGRELLDQAVEAFSDAWAVLGNRQVNLTKFWGNQNPNLQEVHDGLVVAGFAKMHAWRSRNPIDAMRLGAKTSLVIVDEAHQAIASTYKEVIECLSEAGQYNAVLGLTATPGRTWSDITADEALAEFFQNSKILLEVEGYNNPVHYLLENGYLSRPSFHRLDYLDEFEISNHSKSLQSSLDDYGLEELTALAQSTARNRAILIGVEDLISRGHKRIIIFATSVEHARLLSTVLELKGISSPIVTGETPAQRRNEVLRSYRRVDASPIVLCNFGVLTTGFDAPSTSAAVIARPTKSLVLFSQMVGRATRGPRAKGNAESEILTVHDPQCPGFGDIAEAFFNWEDVWGE